jgi:DNA primase
MRINPETVDRIKQTADIVEVVGDFVSLKKKGANYSACCPFHNEKTPSFNVNPSRQIYKCFGCGAAGDSIKFVMDVDGIGYGEALRYLANKYNIEIEEEELTDEEALRQNDRESLYIILNFAKNFYQHQLHNSEEGQAIGLSYFRERGFTNDIRKKFELGYALDTWDSFTKEALAKGYSAEILEKAGLLIHKEGSQTTSRQNAGYDRFRGRVIFPIHNVAGKVIAFGARILKSEKGGQGQKSANQPKYLNSPETEVYHKSDVLYGIFQAKNAIRQLEHCYLVEGYTDVISLHQAGIENVVASSGTSLTVEQIKLIGRFTPNITILYDGDIAGIKAALRGLDLVLEEGLNVSVVLFPDGDDPDSYVRKVGAEAFKAYLKKASKDFITFKTETLLQDAGNDPFRLAAVIGEVVNSIIKIPDAIKRQVFFQRTSEMMKVDEQMLITEGNKLLRKLHAPKPQDRSNRQSAPDGPNDLDSLFDGFRQESNEAPPDLFAPDSAEPETPQRTKLYHQEEAFMRLLVIYGARELEPSITVCQYVLGEIDGIDFKDTVFNHLLTLFRENFNRNQVLSTDYFLNHHESEIRNLTINWLTNKYELSELWSEKYEIYVPIETDVLDKTAFINILRLKKAFIEEKMKVCLQQAVHAKSEEEQHTVMSEFMFYKGISMAAAKELGSVIG